MEFIEIGFAPKRPSAMETKDLRDFVENYLNAMLRERFFDDKLVPAVDGYTRYVQQYIDHEWGHFTREHPEPYYIAEGCEVTGLKLQIIEYQGRFVPVYSWKTQFSYYVPLGNMARSLPKPESVIPLGRFNECLLYVETGWDRPRLVARWGADAEYLSCDMHGVAMDTPPIGEAHRRAMLVNAFAGTPYANPPYIGRLGMPEKQRPFTYGVFDDSRAQADSGVAFTMQIDLGNDLDNELARALETELNHVSPEYRAKLRYLRQDIKLAIARQLSPGMAKEDMARIIMEALENAKM